MADQDDTSRAFLANRLRMDEKFVVCQAKSGSEVRALVCAERQDALIVDTSLPDIEGYQLCQALRQSGVTTPILLLATAPSDSEEILSLDYGANDYLAKPVNSAVLLARLRAHLRNYERSEAYEVEIGPFTLQSTPRRIIDRQSGKSIRLTFKEFRVLQYLYRTNGRPIASNELLRTVWGYHEDAKSHTVETHIYRLRQKLERDPTNPELIVWDTGGYRLLAQNPGSSSNVLSAAPGN